METTKDGLTEKKTKKAVVIPKINRNIIHYDIECYTDKETQVQIPYALGYCYLKKDDTVFYNAFYGVGCIKDFIDMLYKKHEQKMEKKIYFTTYINGFNSNRYDNIYVLDELLKNTDKYYLNVNASLKSSNNLLRLELHEPCDELEPTFVFIDTLNYTVGSLRANLTAFKCEIEKGEIDHTKTDRWIKMPKQLRIDISNYLKKDVLGLCELYGKLNKPYFDNFQINLCDYYSTPHISNSIFKKHFISKTENKDLYRLKAKELKEYIDEAIYGGRCEVFRKSFVSKDKIDNIFMPFNEINDYIKALDITSLYPSAMINRNYPLGLALFTIKFMKGKLGVYKCKVKPPKNILHPILPRRLVGKLCFDLVDRIGFYSSIDIEDAIKNKYSIEIIDGFYWEEQTEIFTKFIEYFYKMKETNEKGSILYENAKLVLNALYGKQLQKQIDDKLIFININDTKKIDKLALNYNNISQLFRVGEYRCMKYGNDETDPQPKNPIILKRDKPRHLGMFILAYSRRIMNYYYKIFNELNILIYYTDTDSIYIHNNDFLKSKIELPVRKTLGQFSDDLDGGKIVEMINIAPKTYTYNYIDFNENINNNMRTKGCLKGTIDLSGFEKMALGYELDVIRPFQLKRSVKDGNVLFQPNTIKTLNRDLTKNRIYELDKSIPYGYKS